MLERNRGTIKRALRGVEPDGFEQGQPRYKLSTVMKAVAAHARLNGGSRSSRVSPIEAELAALEKADMDVKTFLKRLRAERDVDRRRALARSRASVIGALDRAFQDSLTAQGREAIVVFTPLREQAVAWAIGEILSLCDWTIGT